MLPGHDQGKPVRPRKASDLFSDLNQWLLKVLLASELPVHLLNAPRASYRHGSALAEAARVSVMGASRFLRRMREEGFLENFAQAFRVVRCGELFRRWQSAALRTSPELRMACLIPAPGSRQLQKVAVGMGDCIGVFAAADLLKLGHVGGVPPHLYVRHLLPTSPDASWAGLAPVSPGEPAQIILKQPAAPESLFRAAMRVDNVLVSDALQIWLDASVQPSRGAWRHRLVFVGGWAQRLFRLHPRARALEYEPLATLDTDVAFGRQAQLEGSPPLAPAQT